jgi:hypothetical protein
MNQFFLNNLSKFEYLAKQNGINLEAWFRNELFWFFQTQAVRYQKGTPDGLTASKLLDDGRFEIEAQWHRKEVTLTFWATTDAKFKPSQPDLHYDFIVQALAKTKLPSEIKLVPSTEAPIDAPVIQLDISPGKITIPKNFLKSGDEGLQQLADAIRIENIKELHFEDELSELQTETLACLLEGWTLDRSNQADKLSLENPLLFCTPDIALVVNDSGKVLLTEKNRLIREEEVKKLVTTPAIRPLETAKMNLYHSGAFTPADGCKWVPIDQFVGPTWAKIAEDAFSDMLSIEKLHENPKLWVQLLDLLHLNQLEISGPLMRCPNGASKIIPRLSNPTTLCLNAPQQADYVQIDARQDMVVPVQKSGFLPFHKLEKKICIGLVGVTGVGKSSLINSLIGKDILPVANEATSTTKFPISVTHGDQLRVAFTPKAGKVVELENMSIAEVQTALKNAMGKKLPDFDWIDITIPCTDLKNICLVDLPGLLDADVNVITRVEQYLEKVDLIWHMIEPRLKSEARPLDPKLDPEKLQKLITAKKKLELISRKDGVPDARLVKYALSDVYHHQDALNSVALICVNSLHCNKAISGIETLRKYLRQLGTTVSNQILPESSQVGAVASPGIDNPNAPQSTIVETQANENEQKEATSTSNPTINELPPKEFRCVESALELMTQMLHKTPESIRGMVGDNTDDAHSNPELLRRWFARFNRTVVVECQCPMLNHKVTENTIFYYRSKFYILKEEMVSVLAWLNFKGNNTMQKELFEEQWHLCDLHTHLLGMGSAEFWCNTVLFNEQLLPSHEEFHKKTGNTSYFLPKIWDGTHRFLESNQAEKVIDIIAANASKIFLKKIIKQGEETKVKHSDHALATLENILPGIPMDIKKCWTEEFDISELPEGESFLKSFSYDVVFSREKLGDAFFDNPDSDPEILETKIMGMLGAQPSVATSSTSKLPAMKHYIVFNARKQNFQLVYGLTSTHLRQLAGFNSMLSHDSEQCTAVRAHLRNAFSMLNEDGSEPRSASLNWFRGCFTPEFYPKRYALKDCIYEQRLDVLALLLAHVLQRYQSSKPPVEYVEFSIGVNDAKAPCVMEVLTNFSEYLPDQHWGTTLINWTKEGDYKFKYKFLAGFPRTYAKAARWSKKDDKMSFKKKQKQMIQILLHSPETAICDFLDECGTTTSQMFKWFEGQIKQLKNTMSIPSLKGWIVGLDLMGDELGYPYIPFVTNAFIQFIKDEKLGVRIHGGENVLYTSPKHKAFRGFAVHMWILTEGIKYLQDNIKGLQLRIGHGVAYSTILDNKIQLESNFRWSMLLLKDINSQKECLKPYPFELNLTSNHYLLHNGDLARTSVDCHALPSLIENHMKVILSTDNDGIWPLDRCQFAHTQHLGLAAEFCKAISHQWLDIAKIEEMVKCGMETKFLPYDKERSNDNNASQQPKITSPEQFSFLPRDFDRSQLPHWLLQLESEAFQHRAEEDLEIKLVWANHPPVYVLFTVHLDLSKVEKDSVIHWYARPAPQRTFVGTDKEVTLVMHAPKKDEKATKVEFASFPNIVCTTSPNGGMTVHGFDVLCVVYVISRWSPAITSALNISYSIPDCKGTHRFIKRS